MTANPPPLSTTSFVTILRYLLDMVPYIEYFSIYGIIIISPQCQFVAAIKHGNFKISALSNALVLIQKAVNQQAAGLTFSQLVKTSGIPQGSAHRLLKELTELNLLAYEQDRKVYRGGLLLASLGAEVIANYDLRNSARAALKALHKSLGHVVTLGIRDGLTGVYIDKIESDNFSIKLHSEIGKTFPLHSTAMGKVLLAYADKSIQRKALGRQLEYFTPNTITDTAQLGLALERVRKQGYAIDNEEITRGLICVAAPIFKFENELAGALSFTCPKHIFNGNQRKDIINSVKTQANCASAK